MKKELENNILTILEDKKIENIPIDNVPLIKGVLQDEKISVRLEKGFYENFINTFNNNELQMKIQDLLYRINLVVNNCLIDKYGIKDLDKIKEKINVLLDNDMDFYSAVSYDEFDSEIIEECELILYGKEFYKI